MLLHCRTKAYISNIGCWVKRMIKLVAWAINGFEPLAHNLFHGVVSGFTVFTKVANRASKGRVFTTVKLCYRNGCSRFMATGNGLLAQVEALYGNAQCVVCSKI